MKYKNKYGGEYVLIGAAMDYTSTRDAKAVVIYALVNNPDCFCVRDVEDFDNHFTIEEEK